MRRCLAASIVVMLTSAFGLGASAGASVDTKGKPKSTKAELSMINNHVPPATASSCHGYTAGEKKYLLKYFPKEKAQIKNVVTAVQCFPTTQGSPDEVDYVQLANLNDLFGLYQATLDFYSLQGAPGPQANTTGGGGGLAGPTPTTCPSENAYGPTGGTPLGRVLCHPSSTSGSADLVWTQEPLKIYSEALLKTDPDGSLLKAFFKSVNSGPEG